MLLTHATIHEIEALLAEMGPSPVDNGTLEMIVCRPAEGERRLLDHAELDRVEGLVGDNWRARGSRHTEDGLANPDAQITLINSRLIHAIARDRAFWPLAGDQLVVDFDISEGNLYPGQRLAIGSAVLEITPLPHTGCGKFTERFGHDAIRFVNSPEGRQARRRGIYARVVQPGVIHVGDTITKIGAPG